MGLRPAWQEVRGFTLIEMLVALVIMGLFAGLITSVIRPDERTLLHVEAERLAQLLVLAGTEARMSGRPVVWVSDGAGYQFWRYRTGTGWREVADDTLLRKRTLPQGITIAGIRMEAARGRESMRLEFSSRGLTPAYDISMFSGTQRYTVSGSPLGDVEVLAGEKKANADILLQ